MLKQNSKKGFTIIEVVLVLAIAGLIFLMVFVAFPSLQRSRNDSQRQQDLNRALTAAMNYQRTHNGNIPNFDAEFINNYLKVAGDTFQDPTGTEYKFYKTKTGNQEGIGDCGSTSGDCSPGVQAVGNFAPGFIIAVKNAKCDGEKTVYANGNNKFAILMKLEGAGVACYNN